MPSRPVRYRLQVEFLAVPQRIQPQGQQVGIGPEAVRDVQIEQRGFDEQITAMTALVRTLRENRDKLRALGIESLSITAVKRGHE